MATALIVTFITTVPCGPDQGQTIAMSSQTLTFVDVGPAQKALDAIKEAYKDISVGITGVILKDVVI